MLCCGIDVLAACIKYILRHKFHVKYYKRRLKYMRAQFDKRKHCSGGWMFNISGCCVMCCLVLRILSALHVCISLYGRKYPSMNRRMDLIILYSQYALVVFMTHMRVYRRLKLILCAKYIICAYKYNLWCIIALRYAV